MRPIKPHILLLSIGLGKPFWRYTVSDSEELNIAAEVFCRRLNRGLGFA